MADTLLLALRDIRTARVAGLEAVADERISLWRASYAGAIKQMREENQGAATPVKVKQRSGGCWRTLDGLADFATIWSYLSTAAKHGISALDALTRLFTSGLWLPPLPA